MSYEIHISKTDNQGYDMKTYLNLLLARQIASKLESGEIRTPEGPDERIYVLGYVDGVPSRDGRYKAAFKIMPNTSIYVVDYEDTTEFKRNHYSVTVELRFDEENGNTIVKASSFALRRGVETSPLTTDLSMYHLPDMQYGVGFKGGGVRIFHRPKLYVRPITKHVTMPFERDSVITMDIEGLHIEATLIRVLMFGESERTLETKINRLTLTDEPYIDDPNSDYDRDLVPNYVKPSEIYEGIKGITYTMIRNYYDVPEDKSDEWIRRHYQITEKEIFDFEWDIANTTDAFWRALER